MCKLHRDTRVLLYIMYLYKYYTVVYTLIIHSSILIYYNILLLLLIFLVVGGGEWRFETFVSVLLS